jgi:hypothetical protein
MIAVSTARPLRRQYRRFVLRYVGECLYRSDYGSYFAVVKHQGKQHRHCLQTKDRESARRKLAEYHQKLGVQAPAADPVAPTLEKLAGQWLETTRVFLKPSSAKRREYLIAALVPYFQTAVRRITRVDVEQWAGTRSKKVAAASSVRRPSWPAACPRACAACVKPLPLPRAA